MSNMKTVLSVLVAMLMLSGIAMAGNLGGTDSNTVTTLAVESATINTPVGGENFMNNNINVAYTSSGTGLKYTVSRDGVDVANGALPEASLTVDTTTAGSYVVTILGEDNVTVLDTVSFSADHTGPAPVTNITSSNVTTTGITWSWENPGGDFKNVRVTVKAGDAIVNGYDNLALADGVNTVDVTGLTQNTAYTITVQTEDNAVLQ